MLYEAIIAYKPAENPTSAANMHSDTSESKAVQVHSLSTEVLDAVEYDEDVLLPAFIDHCFGGERSKHDAVYGPILPEEDTTWKWGVGSH